MTGKYLINTDSWFIAPDGKSYTAVFGEVEVLKDEFLGIKTNARSSNWYVKVGDENNHVIIAGCEIHYAIKCDSVNIGDTEGYEIANGEVYKYMRPTRIYIP